MLHIQLGDTKIGAHLAGAFRKRWVMEIVNEKEHVVEIFKLWDTRIDKEGAEKCAEMIFNYARSLLEKGIPLKDIIHKTDDLIDYVQFTIETEEFPIDKLKNTIKLELDRMKKEQDIARARKH